MNLFIRQAYKFSLSKFNSQKDYYKVLGVTQSSGEKDIKKAFRQMAKKYHPDASTGNQEKFKQVNQAYQVLSQASVKRQYDQARSYSQRPQGNQSYGNQYGNGQSPYQQQQSAGNYQNYQNGQYYYNQSFHQSYQHPNQQYRGYTRPDGWQNQKYRQDIMNDIFKEYQRNRAQYGSYQNMYQNHQENIRQYTEQLKRRQDKIRKAYQAEEIRKQKQWRDYQQKQMKDLQEKIVQKVVGLKQGLTKNVQGFLKVGDFLKDTLKGTIKNVKDALKDKDDKGNKKK